MKKLLQIITGFSLCIATSTSTALDLNEAMELAQQNDTTFQIAYANYLATIEASSLSTSAVLPQIDFNAFYQQGRTENDKTGVITKSDNNNDGYSLNLNQVIFDKTIFDNLDEGDAIAAKAVADLESARQEPCPGFWRARKNRLRPRQRPHGQIRYQPPRVSPPVRFAHAVAGRPDLSCQLASARSKAADN